VIAPFLAASLALIAMADAAAGRGLPPPLALRRTAVALAKAGQTPAIPAPTEVIREVRVHGNAYLTDAEVLALAGVAIGDAVSAETVAAIERRLKDSGRFETVQIRKRYRSLADPTDVAIVLVVHEKPGVRSIDDPTAPLLAPWRRVRSRLMFLPILNYGDGYGFTYGARFSTMDLLGAGERLSFPLTWGGVRRAAIEAERQFKSGPLTRVDSSLGIWQRENPRFEIDDRRIEFKGRAEKDFATILRFSVDGSRSNVHFAALDDRLWTVGGNVAIDTRANPSFPRNAIYLGTGWTGLHVNSRPRINRYTAEARGYVGLIRQAVLAGRVQYTGADTTLPPYERLLLGGAPTLRGYRAGTFDGDRLLVTSAELRVPITSVISGGTFGVTAFMDAGKIIDHDGRFEDVRWNRGAGAGIFLIASVFRINLDVARGLDNRKTRLHLATGFSF
jgi:outer membrane protein assembly factor BamA